MQNFERKMQNACPPQTPNSPCVDIQLTASPLPKSWFHAQLWELRGTKPLS